MNGHELFSQRIGFLAHDPLELPCAEVARPAANASRSDTFAGRMPKPTVPAAPQPKQNMTTAVLPKPTMPVAAQRSTVSVKPRPKSRAPPPTAGNTLASNRASVPPRSVSANASSRATLQIPAASTSANSRPSAPKSPASHRRVSQKAAGGTKHGSASVAEGDPKMVVDLRPSGDVKPERCSTEKELSREFDAIHRTLSDSRGDWHHRMGALKRAQGLVLGCAQLENFVPVMLKLRDVFVAQVQDLRSAVCREACSVLFVLVHALGAEFEPFALAALPVLFRIALVSIHIIAESGFQCIRAIVRECRTFRVLGVVLEQLNSKSGVQRWRCAQALLVALETHPVSALEKQVEALENAIRQALEDASENVRACGQQCFWAFNVAFEKRGTRLFARLDSAKQRALDASRPTPSDERCESADACNKAWLDDFDIVRDRSEHPDRSHIVSGHEREDRSRVGMPRRDHDCDEMSQSSVRDRDRDCDEMSQASVLGRDSDYDEISKVSMLRRDHTRSEVSKVGMPSRDGQTRLEGPTGPAQEVPGRSNLPRRGCGPSLRDGASSSRLGTRAAVACTSGRAAPQRKGASLTRRNPAPTPSSSSSSKPPPERLPRQHTANGTITVAGRVAAALARCGAQSGEGDGPTTGSSPVAQPSSAVAPKRKAVRQTSRTKSLNVHPSDSKLRGLAIPGASLPDSVDIPAESPVCSDEDITDSNEWPEEDVSTTASLAPSASGISEASPKEFAKGSADPRFRPPPRGPVAHSGKNVAQIARFLRPHGEKLPCRSKVHPSELAPKGEKENGVEVQSGDLAAGCETAEPIHVSAACSVEQLCELVRTADAPSQRAKALGTLAERLRLVGVDTDADTASLGDDHVAHPAELVELALAGIADAPPVPRSALSALRTLLALHPGVCAKHLGRILIALLGKISPAAGDAVRQDKEEDVQAARSCMRLAIDGQDPSVLLHALRCAWGTVSVSDADDTFPRQRPAAMVVALELMETDVLERKSMCDYLAGRHRDQEDELSSLSTMRVVIEDMLSCSGIQVTPRDHLASSSGVRRMAARALHVLFLKETRAFVGSIMALSPGVQDGLCNLLAHLIPELRTRLAVESANTPAVSVQNAAAAHAPSTQLPVARGARETPTQASDNSGSLQAPLVAPQRDANTVKRLSIPALLAQCGPATLAATLRALAQAARTEGPESWDRHFGRVLILVLDSLAHVDAVGVRDAALLCLQELVTHVPTLFKDFAEVVASKLFDTYESIDDSVKPAAASVDRTLERLMSVVEPARALEIVLPLLQCDSSQQMLAAIKLLAPVLQRMSADVVLQHLETVLPGVVQAFGHMCSEVRKTAVFCLVDVYMILGEQVMPYYVKDLTPSQMKLVTIYIGRQQRERDELQFDDRLPDRRVGCSEVSHVGFG